MSYEKTLSQQREQLCIGPQKARERGEDQENYGEGQWRASLKPCCRPGDQLQSWSRIDSGGGSLLLPYTPQGVKDNDDGQIFILMKN